MEEQENTKLLLAKPYIFDDIGDLPNVIGCVRELDLTGECSVEFTSNVEHIKPFKTRMPLGWCNKIKSILALPNKADGSG